MLAGGAPAVHYAQSVRLELVLFEDVDGLEVYVNPERVMRVREYSVNKSVGTLFSTPFSAFLREGWVEVRGNIRIATTLATPKMTSRKILPSGPVVPPLISSLPTGCTRTRVCGFPG